MSGVLAAIGARSASTLQVTVTRSTLSGTKYGTGTLTTLFSYATPVGGIAPYTYLWSFSGSDDGISLSDPTASGVRAQKTSATVPATASSTITCTVTDSVGTTGESDPVSIELEWL